MWSWQATAGDTYDIFEIEAVGSALILHSWLHHITPGASWLHITDTDAALATRVEGSASVLSGGSIMA